MSERDEDTARAGARARAELVTVIRCLRASLGEQPPAESVTMASSDDELRAMVDGLQRRLDSRSNAGPVALGAPERPTPPAAGWESTSATGRRPCCILLTTNTELATKARKLMARRGIPLLIAGNMERLGQLLASVVPTHLVVQSPTGAQLDLAGLVGRHLAEVQVRWSTSVDTTIAALLSVVKEGERHERE